MNRTFGPAFAAVIGVGLASSAWAVPVPIVYYDFQTGLTNQGSLGAIDNATATGGATGGAPGGINGNGLGLSQASSQAMNSPITQAQAGASFSISAWFNLNTTNISTTAERFYVYEGGNNYDISFGTPGSYAQGAASVTYETFIQQGTAAYTTGNLATTSNAANVNWHNVVQTFASDGTNTTMTTYIDGVAVNAFTPTTAVPQVTISGGLDIGDARSGAGRYWNGAIDEFAIWNAALSPSDVSSIYNNGAPTELPLPAPEPSALGLMGFAALGLLGRRRAARSCR